MLNLRPELKIFRWICGSHHKTAISVATMTFVTLALPAPGATIVFNGSFENVGIATSSFSINNPTVLPSWAASPSGNQILDCVVFAGATTDYCGNAFGGGFRFWINPGPSPDGGNYVTIDGDPNFATPLQQTVTGLVVGTQYRVSFYQAAAQQHGFDGATTERWKVNFGTGSQLSTLMNTASHGDVGWMSQTLTYTATAATQVLSFIAIGTPNGVPPFVLLDGVSINAVTPEPETYMLMGIGLLSMSIVGRLRKMRS